MKKKSKKKSMSMFDGLSEGLIPSIDKRWVTLKWSCNGDEWSLLVLTQKRWFSACAHAGDRNIWKSNWCKSKKIYSLAKI